MKIPLTPYGLKEIILGTIVLGLLSVLLINLGLFYWIILPVGLFCFLLYFFRDPERTIPSEANLILAPADGRVIEISEVKEDNFLKDEALKIAIFLSLFDVHINRAPAGGQVQWLDYCKGKFLVASKPSTSRVNESNAMGISNHLTKVLVRQVAGLIARRIVCIPKRGDLLQAGQRIGMIKFGSRAEVYLPKKDVENIQVKLNDKVKGGETVIARIKS